MWLNIDKTAPTVDTNIISSYIAKKLDISGKDLIIEQLKTLGTNQSFKVGIKAEYYDIVNSCDFWPKGITFRRFNFKRHSFNHGVTFPENQK